MNDKRLFHTLVIVICSFACNCIPQFISAQWVFQNSITSQNLHSISFVDSLSGWIVGDSGIILHTTTAGETWTRQNSGTTNNLLSVSFCDNQNGWAVGNSGMILKTSNSGNTWDRISHNTSVNIRNLKVHCLSPSMTFILCDSLDIDFYTNQRIWKTTDAGKSWNIVFQAGFSSNITDMQFNLSNNGWIIGHGGYPYGYEIHRTTDAGIIWAIYSFNAPTYNRLSRVTFDDDEHGWVSDGDTLYGSSDGGRSWSVISIPYFGELTDLWKRGDIGYQSSRFGKISKTTNGGLTWMLQQSSPALFVENLEFITPNIGWAVGWRGMIIHTINGGTTSISDQSNTEVPSEFKLYQNYPNPFNPSTNIIFSTPQTAFISIVIYDPLGNEIDVIVNREFLAGNYSIPWIPRNVASGVYFYRMTAGDITFRGKLIFIK
jgi:photosystem II stability/assembly factor-like uncharacterized protein